MRLPFLISITLLLTACGSKQRLVTTPYIMLEDDARSFYDAAPQPVKTPNIPIVYFTDRRNEADADEQPDFDAERARTISFGTATIALDPQPTWEQLVIDSTSPKATRKYVASVENVEITGTIAPLISRLEVRDDRVVYPPQASADFLQELDDFAQTLEPWLKEDDNAAIVFVHGFSNTFDGASIRLAKTWHAIGRDAVPILYTWPSGYDAFKPIAYNHDRESGEFGVLHLKALLMALALNDRIDRVHLIAHSRGTDVATTALREIDAEVEAAQANTTFGQLTQRLAQISDAEFVERNEAVTAADVLKLETLLLVAPDLDIDVFTQRFLAERGERAAKRVVVYTSRHDRAISLASLLFADGRRLGRAQMKDFSPRAQALIGALPSLELVEVNVKSKDSHLYLFEHPAALSDMIRVVRDRKKAGAEHGRPLKPLAPGFWQLDKDYLKPTND